MENLGAGLHGSVRRARSPRENTAESWRPPANRGTATNDPVALPESYCALLFVCSFNLGETPALNPPPCYPSTWSRKRTSGMTISSSDITFGSPGVTRSLEKMSLFFDVTSAGPQRLVSLFAFCPVSRRLVSVGKYRCT